MLLYLSILNLNLIDVASFHSFKGVDLFCCTFTISDIAKMSELAKYLPSFGITFLEEENSWPLFITKADLTWSLEIHIQCFMSFTGWPISHTWGHMYCTYAGATYKVLILVLHIYHPCWCHVHSTLVGVTYNVPMPAPHIMQPIWHHV